MLGIVPGFYFGIIVKEYLFAFTEPVSSPNITQPIDATSQGALFERIGTPNSTTANEATLFNHLRKLAAETGLTPISTSPDTSDQGEVFALIGDPNPSQDSQKNLFTFLRTIINNLDFPEPNQVLSSATTKNQSGTIVNRGSLTISGANVEGPFSAGYYSSISSNITNRGTPTYTTPTPSTTTQSTSINSGYHDGGVCRVLGDSNLVAGNIISGKTIYGVSGIVNAVSSCGGNTSTTRRSGCTTNIIMYTGTQAYCDGAWRPINGRGNPGSSGAQSKDKFCQERGHSGSAFNTAHGITGTYSCEWNGSEWIGPIATNQNYSIVFCVD